MSVEVRPRHENDIDALAHVLVRVHARDGYPVEGVGSPRAWLTPPNEMAAWTAVVDGQPIGHICVTAAGADDDATILWQRHTGGDIAQLVIPVRLFVDPEHRHRGAARQLISAAYTSAIEQGYAVAGDVMLKDRAAIQLYESLGARRLGDITHRHSDGQSEQAAVYTFSP